MPRRTGSPSTRSMSRQRIDKIPPTVTDVISQMPQHSRGTRKRLCDCSEPVESVLNVPHLGVQANAPLTKHRKLCRLTGYPGCRNALEKAAYLAAQPFQRPMQQLLAVNDVFHFLVALEDGFANQAIDACRRRGMTRSTARSPRGQCARRGPSVSRTGRRFWSAASLMRCAMSLSRSPFAISSTEISCPSLSPNDGPTMSSAFDVDGRVSSSASIARIASVAPSPELRPLS